MSEDLTKRLSDQPNNSEELLRLIQSIHAELAELKQTVDARLHDTRPIWEKVQTDITQLQEGQQRLEEGQESLRKDVRDVRTELRDMNRKLAIHVAQLRTHVADIFTQRLLSFFKPLLSFLKLRDVRLHFLPDRACIMQASVNGLLQLCQFRVDRLN